MILPKERAGRPKYQPSSSRRCFATIKNVERFIEDNNLAQFMK
jgi:hypothetical protein